MRCLPLADFVTNGYGSKNRMLCDTPLMWSFFDLANILADLIVCFLYMSKAEGNQIRLPICLILVIGKKL